jgi:hypothetical protein
MDAATPFTPRTPRRWELHTFGLLVLVAASAFFSLVLLVVYLGIFVSVDTHGRSGTSVIVDLAVRHGAGLDDVYFALAIAYIFVQAWWQRETLRMLEAFHVTDTRVAQHWTTMVWRFVLVFSFLLRTVGNSLLDQGGASADRGQTLSSVGVYAAGHAVRMAALGLLLFGVWKIRDQVRQAVAASGVAPTPAQLGLRRNLTPAAPLPPVRSDASLATAAMPLADDDFWARVQSLAADKGGDLALLDSSSAWVRRWLLIPATGPLEGVRASIPAGSVVTVFSQPPQPGVAAPREPPPTEPGAEWFGLLQDGGTLRYQLVKPSRLPVWRAQARSVQRWGLYRTDDPAALTAVMPSPAPAAEPAL